LTGHAIEAALDAGETMADMSPRDGLIEGAVLVRACDWPLPLLEPA
jgi:hypothetical protein